MSTGLKFARFAGLMVLCLGTLNAANAASEQHQRKAKKPQPPPLPSGPTGPVPQIPLDSIAPVPPEVSFQNGQLTIVAPNSTLGDVLRAVRKQTGADIDVPVATDRVVTHLGPGPTREVMAELLNGSRFNYVLLGSPSDVGALTRVVLVAKTGPDRVNTGNPPMDAQSPVMTQTVNVPQPPPEMASDGSDADASDENADETVDQPADADAEQPAAAPPDQGAVKTPQQLLQEMQQRQLQIQQQQPPGQPPIPGPGVPHPQPDQQ
jgi:hypothetical protein